MGWSIARKDGGTIPEGQASINESGVATFGRHETTDDTIYVITYTDTDCGTVTKDFTVKGCNETPKNLACWRGTNNGFDYYEDGTKESNPILLCGCQNDNSGDSIYVRGGLSYSLTGNAPWKPLANGLYHPEHWFRIQLVDGPMCCGGDKHINVEALERFEGTDDKHERSAIIWLKATEYEEGMNVPDCAGDPPCEYEGAGKKLCEKWEYEVKQCAIGYCWCGEHSKNAVAVPCGECEGTVKRDCTEEC